MAFERHLRTIDAVTREVCLHADGQRLQLDASYQDGVNGPVRRWFATFDTTETPWRVAAGERPEDGRRGPSCLSLSDGLPEDVGRDAFAWVLGRLSVWPDASLAPKRLSDWGGDEEWLFEPLRSVTAYVRRMTDDAARTAAASFPIEQRLFLLERFTKDGTGRLLQHVAPEPGVLLLLAALQKVSTPDTAWFAAFLEGTLQQGSSLNWIIEVALEAFLRAGLDGRLRTDPAVLEAMRALDALPSAVRKTRMKQWRLLVRRAGRLVTPALLLRPPPLAFVPEEIPTEPEANAAWYAAMASHDGVISAAVAGGEVLGCRFARALSRHPHLAEQSGFLLRYLGEHPGTSLLDVDARQASRKLLRYRIRLHKQSLRFGPPPVSGVEVPSVHVWPLDSETALRGESQEMSHCAETYADAVREGHCYLYGAWIEGERLTIELQPGDDGVWRIVQVKGPQNVGPTAEALQMLATWCPFHDSWGPIQPFDFSAPENQPLRTSVGEAPRAQS